MHFQITILALLAFTTAPLLATPPLLSSTALQPRTIQAENCRRLNLSIAAVQDRLSDDCDAQCEEDANEALGALKAMQEQVPC